MRKIMCSARTRKNSMDTLFAAVETLYWTLPRPDNRWPTYEQNKRLYERATIEVLFKRLDDSDDSEDHKATLKTLLDGLLTIEDNNPDAPGIRDSIELLKDLMGGNYDG